MSVLYTVLFLMCSSSVALSGLVIIGRLHYCVRVSRGFPNRKFLGLNFLEQQASILLLSSLGKHFNHDAMLINYSYTPCLNMNLGETLHPPLQAYIHMYMMYIHRTAGKGASIRSQSRVTGSPVHYTLSS